LRAELAPASSNRSAPPLPRRRRCVIPRRLVASGSGLLALRRLVGIQRLLELAPFYLRDDLDEHGHDDRNTQRTADGTLCVKQLRPSGPGEDRNDNSTTTPAWIAKMAAPAPLDR
jgi:hypothetical protein